MGLIKSIFGAIFGVIGGVFGAIGGLVGLGKKSEFYMEIPEADANQATPKESPAVVEAKPTPVAKATPVAKTTPVAKAKTAGKPAAQAAPVAAQPPKAPVAAVTGFATNYLSVSSPASSRRRPGPSLSPFRTMAREVQGR